MKRRLNILCVIVLLVLGYSVLKNEVLFNKIILIRNKYGVHKYTYFGNRETSIKKIL